jgi:hypothetical protein
MALEILNLGMYLHVLLEDAQRVPGLDPTFIDACWKRCRDVRLTQALIEVRLVWVLI